MNKQNQLLADYVYLAEASYTDFSKSDDAYKELKGAINESFAKLVTNNYEVVAHYKDRIATPTDEFLSAESSFSGTLFQNTKTNQYVLAFKGTKEGKDLFATDAADIVANGLAHQQILDMYNFYQQLITPRGQVP